MYSVAAEDWQAVFQRGQNSGLILAGFAYKRFLFEDRPNYCLCGSERINDLARASSLQIEEEHGRGEPAGEMQD